MTFETLFHPGAIAIDRHASSKRHALGLLAEAAAKAYGFHEEAVLAMLLDREKQGSTGFGGGVAIPHGKLAGKPTTRGVVMRFKPAAPFEALDDKPIDLAFLLISPLESGGEHLRALAEVSRLCRQPEALAKIRGATTADALYAVMAAQSRPQAA